MPKRLAAIHAKNAIFMQNVQILEEEYDDNVKVRIKSFECAMFVKIFMFYSQLCITIEILMHRWL